MLDHDIDKLGVKIGKGCSCLHILLQSDVLLQLVPEIEGDRDGLSVLVSNAAFEDCLNQISELSRHASNEDDPSLASFGENPGNALHQVIVFGLSSLLAIFGRNPITRG